MTPHVSRLGGSNGERFARLDFPRRILAEVALAPAPGGFEGVIRVWRGGTRIRAERAFYRDLDRAAEDLAEAVLDLEVQYGRED